MPTKVPGVWGIDLGQSALKAIRLEMKDGQPVATAFEYIEHPKILSQPDADPDELAREALNQFLSRNQIRHDLIAISVPGQSGLARFVKLPPVDEKKIADIVKFEAKQQIPFPLEEVVWDFQRLNKGDIIDGLALETEIGLFAMKRDMVTRSIAQFKDVNVEVHLVQMAPLALCNLIAYDLLGKTGGGALAEDDANHDCIVALEIGTDSSNLVITDGGRIIWQRPIPIGGNHFTRALTKEMKLTFAKAEHLKKNAAKSPDLKKILSSLKQVLNDFVGEVQRSLGYFTNTHRNANIQYMVGLGNAFRLPGLQKFLQEKLQLEVRKFTKLERTTGEAVTTAPTFSENIMSFGVAYGLALQGLKQAHLQTNLLPYEVRLERVIRGKKPWAVAAAACLIFGMCMLAFAQGQERRALGAEDNKKQETALKSTVKVSNDRDAAKAARKKELDDYLESLRRIGAGVNERINWQLLHQYVNMSAPQPNGARLTKDGKGFIGSTEKKYWTNNSDAQVAYRLFEQKKVGQLKDMSKQDVDFLNAFFKANKDNKEMNTVVVHVGKDPSPGDTEKIDRFIKRNLIQVNISGVNALFTEDLGPYFRKIYKDGEVLRGMAPAERALVEAFAKEDDPEKGKDSPLFKKGKDGWVVEIRGYTYYHADEKFGGDNFVNETIIENLKYASQLDDKNPKDKEMIARIKERVDFLHVYLSDTVKVGEPSKIAKSQLRVLIQGIQPEGKGGGGGGGALGMGGGGGKPGPPPGQGAGGGMANQPGVGGGGGGGAAGEAKPDRSAWTPIGDIARAVLADGGGGGGAGNFAPPAGGAPKAGGFGPKAGFPKGNAPPFGGMPMGGDAGKVENNPSQGLPRTEFILLFVWREPRPAPAAGADDKK